MLPQFFIDAFAMDPIAFEQLCAALAGKDETHALMGDWGNDCEIDSIFALHEEKRSFLLRSLKERIALKKTITTLEKRSLLYGMLLTRETDNTLKRLFLSGDMHYQGKGFQGKGFRSLGQEAIFGASLKLHVGDHYSDNGRYVGDVAAPLIRDLGVFLAMSGGDVATAINAQAGKVGKPSDGRDLHGGDFSKGIIMPAAPLAIATATVTGIGLSFALKNEPRVAVSFIGEGGSSLGEWHEAINFASVRRLPMIFCIENNQTALSTPVSMQSRLTYFAHKAYGYGINSMIIDGNDVEAISCGFKFAADEARAGRGPVLIELITMRMCGHAHHDDMLYLGKDPCLDFTIEPPSVGGYVDTELYEQWRSRDPIARYQTTLLIEGVISETELVVMQKDAMLQVSDAVKEVIARPWPSSSKSDHEAVFKAPWIFIRKTQPLRGQFRSANSGATYLSAIAEGVRQSFIKHPLCRLLGEDVAPPYGNAFMMFHQTMDGFADRFINTPIAENALVGACVGMALCGMRPIGELQFNDFVACAMNQVANNAAFHFFRTGLNLPMVLRMPFGGLRRAGPFHSQDTSPWFYRVPGLKIMAPSIPSDAMHMLMRAVDDPDPVLFYEHIALYRDPRIKQDLSEPIPDIDGAVVRSYGKDLTIISYGAFVHTAMQAAEMLGKKYNKTADVIDLRYLSPVDFDAICESLRKTSRVLLVGEDKKSGGILEVIASVIAEQMFSFLDAPVTVLGGRNTPVPYAPSLEDEYLVGVASVVREAQGVIEY